MACNTELFLNTVTVRNSELTLNVLCRHSTLCLVSGALDPQKCLMSFSCSYVKRTTHGACPDVKDTCLTNSFCSVPLVNTRVPAPEVLKNSMFFKTFSFNNLRPIQGLLPVLSFYSIQPYWYSRKKTHRFEALMCDIY